MKTVEIKKGNSPIILAMPHTGTYLPNDITAQLNERGKALADTDWHIHTLYEDLLPNATTIRATFHRYVIDANRAPSDESLYPGQNTTGLCPTVDFEGQAIYKLGCEPDAQEIKQRCAEFHAPYHQSIEAEIERIKSLHGFAVLYDCHSIQSKLPFLFDGKLPNFNIGTNDGVTCSPELEQVVKKTCEESTEYTCVLNGRFKGGWTTRHYGQPLHRVHAIQMELTQSSYMEEKSPWKITEPQFSELRSQLRRILKALEECAMTSLTKTSEETGK